jgi:hypothetical protein
MSQSVTLEEEFERWLDVLRQHMSPPCKQTAGMLTLASVLSDIAESLRKLTPEQTQPKAMVQPTEKVVPLPAIDPWHVAAQAYLAAKKGQV